MLKRSFILFICLLLRCPSESTLKISSFLDSSGIIVELKKPNLKKIVAEVVKIKGGRIGRIIEMLESHSPGWRWVLKEGHLPDDVNGQSRLTSIGVLTTLDYRKLENASNLSIARTIIHEMVHAYLTLYFRYDQIRAIQDHPEIYKAWQRNQFADYNKIQHDEIEKTFLNDIATALKEFGVKKKLHVANIVYSDLAWGGLDVKNSRLLTALEKIRIQSRLIAEQSNR